MKRVRWFSNFCGFLALLLAIALTAGAWKYRSAPPLMRQSSQDAGQCVQTLLESLIQGDFDTVERLLEGNPSLGLERKQDASLENLLWEQYLKSISFTLQGDLYSTDTGLAQNVTIRHLDVAAAVESAGPLARALLLEMVEEASDTAQLYDENGTYRQELVDQVLLQAAKAALQTPPMTQTSLTLKLRNQSGTWQIQPEDALLNLLSGGIGK